MFIRSKAKLVLIFMNTADRPPTPPGRKGAKHYRSSTLPLRYADYGASIKLIVKIMEAFHI
jgi:hypothetical protein